MLKSLHLRNVGPAPEMTMELGSRLNVITGDNGLGKSFLLDVAWWALTKRWPQESNAALSSGYPARPTNPRELARISYKYESQAGFAGNGESDYEPLVQAWPGVSIPFPPFQSGLVVYVLADGSFAVWDPYRNSALLDSRFAAVDTYREAPERPLAYVFSDKNVWNGLDINVGGKTTRACNGLLVDWASWIREKGDDARRMAAVLAKLGAEEARQVFAPEPTFARLSLDDARDIPTIRMSYNQVIPILHASLGIRRIIALAYMLCWAWREHRIAASLVGKEPVPRIVLLFDEVEAHLHPKWQRAIIPALLEVTRTLTEDDSATVQLIAATHSPLVLASLEPVFDTSKDKLFTLDVADGQVELREEAWAKQGDVINWLVSDSFGLNQGRSIEAEVAIEAAEAWMRGDTSSLPVHLSSKEAIHNELLRVLAGHDPFWPRWIVTAEVVS